MDNDFPFASYSSNRGENSNSQLNYALLLTSLRRLVIAWRERAKAAPDREAFVYNAVEADLAAVVADQATTAVWSAARDDLVRAVLAALDERDRGEV